MTKAAAMKPEVGDVVAAMVPVGQFAVSLAGEVVATSARTVTVRWSLPTGQAVEEKVTLKLLRSEHWGVIDRSTGLPKPKG